MDGNYSETAVARAERRKRPEPGSASGSSSTSTPDRPSAAGVGTPAVPPASSSSSLLATAAPVRRDTLEARDAGDRDSSKRRRRIKSLEEKISALESEVDRLEARLWEEALTLGPIASRDLSAQKAAKKEELDRLVEDWAKLAEEESHEAGARP